MIDHDVSHELNKHVLFVECPQYGMIIDELLDRANLSKTEIDIAADALVFLYNLGMLFASYQSPKVIQEMFSMMYDVDLSKIATPKKEI